MPIKRGRGVGVRLQGRQRLPGPRFSPFPPEPASGRLCSRSLSEWSRRALEGGRCESRRTQHQTQPEEDGDI